VKFKDFIDDCRRQLSDSVAPYRWDDPVLVRYHNNGQREIYREHPECVVTDTTVVTDPPEDLTEADIASGDLNVRDFFAGALLDFVCGSAFGEDSEDANNQAKAAEHWSLFAAKMQ